MRSELTSLTGVAGEHYVLFELLRKGYIAALAPTGIPLIRHKRKSEVDPDRATAGAAL